MENTDVVAAINALAEAQDNALEAAEARHKTEIKVLTEKIEEQDNRNKKRLRRNNIVWLLIWVISLVGFDKISPYLRPNQAIFNSMHNAIIWDDPVAVKQHWSSVNERLQRLLLKKAIQRNCVNIIKLFQTGELKLTDRQKELIETHSRKKKSRMHEFESQAFDEGWAAAMKEKHD